MYLDIICYYCNKVSINLPTLLLLQIAPRLTFILFFSLYYCRCESIDWNYVVMNFIQIVICVFYIYYIFIRFLVPNFQNFNRDHITLQTFVISSFGCMMPGTLCLLIGMYQTIIYPSIYISSMCVSSMYVSSMYISFMYMYVSCMYVSYPLCTKYLICRPIHVYPLCIYPTPLFHTYKFVVM